jgi:hypothetical protein
MKKLLLIGLFLLSLSSFSQALENSAFYKCKIVTTENTYFYSYFYVNSYGEVRQIENSDNTYKLFNTYKTLSNSTSTVYTWANAGGVWSETQTFVFTKEKNTGFLTLNYFRVVQNEGSVPWTLIGLGEVEKYFK